VSIVGPPGIQGVGRQGPPGAKGSVIAGVATNVQMHTNQFIQHRTTNLRRPIIIIEQPTFMFQRVR
jgi:hypothetical protein